MQIRVRSGGSKRSEMQPGDWQAPPWWQGRAQMKAGGPGVRQGGPRLGTDVAVPQLNVELETSTPTA